MAFTHRTQGATAGRALIPRLKRPRSRACGSFVVLFRRLGECCQGRGAPAMRPRDRPLRQRTVAVPGGRLSATRNHQTRPISEDDGPLSRRAERTAMASPPESGFAPPVGVTRLVTTK